MANFLYWDYLVWFSYAAMPVVIFFIILFKHKGKSANSNPEELKSSSLRSKNHIKKKNQKDLTLQLFSKTSVLLTILTQQTLFH